MHEATSSVRDAQLSTGANLFSTRQDLLRDVFHRRIILSLEQCWIIGIRASWTKTIAFFRIFTYNKFARTGGIIAN
jgi:hypothetical protein